MNESDGGAGSPYGPLSAEEREILWNKGTEMPGSGKYVGFFGRGVYTCRNCGAPLYASDDKFNSGCGWPAFDGELPGAVKRRRDPDNVSGLEIRCAACDAHLGHVFTGERLTPRNLRHCVNSASLVFEPENGKRIQRAVFAGGCFWGVEQLMRQQPGVLAAVCGYTGGTIDFPAYRQVCSGKTGHAEAVEVFFDPAKTDFATLCRYFLEIHDPTQQDRQGPDVGKQYRSAIFYFDDAQKNTAATLLKSLRDKGYDVRTELVPFRRFWAAEPQHQNYYGRTGKTPYCHIWQKRF